MLTTAFILGLTGSLHCAGMCSPLAFAVTSMKKGVWINRLVYNLGRILTYGILGAVVSTIGVALPLEKFQAGLSAGMGAFLIAVGIFGLGKVKFQDITRWSSKLSSWLKGHFSSQIQKKGALSTLFLGALNGLLPCGLSFIALTACLIAPTALNGLYFMLIFGAGTLPVMLGFLSLVQFLVGRFNLNFARVNTIMLILAGSLLIARVYWTHDHESMISKTPVEMEICE